MPPRVEPPTGLGVASSLPEGTLTRATPPVGSTAAVPGQAPAAAAARLVGRDALIYGLGTVIMRAASFIMLPIYTHYLTTADYGLLQMLDMAIDVVSLLVSAGSMVGVMRFYFKATSETERKAVVSTAFMLLTGLNLAGTVLLAVGATPVWQHALAGAGARWYVQLAAVNFTVAGLIVVPMLYMQVQARAGLYTLTAVSKLVIQLALNIFFVVRLHTGPVGILFSTFIANGIVGSAAAIWMFRSTSIRFSRAAAADLHRFGVPYQIATAGTFILTFGDRFFLEPTHGLAVVGIYSFAYQFGFLVETLGRAPYSQAWTPRRYETVDHPKAERDEQNNTGFLHQSLLVITVAVGIGVFVHPLLRVMSKVEFLPAADLVPIILLAYVIQGWGETVQFGINVSEQTRYSTYAVWTSVVVVLALYTALIPGYSGLGAAVATAVSFALRTTLLYRFAQRLWPVSYEWRPQLRLTGVAAVVVGASYFVRFPSLPLETAAMCALLLGYGILTWLIVLSSHRRAEILAYLTTGQSRLIARLGRVSTP